MEYREVQSDNADQELDLMMCPVVGDRAYNADIIQQKER